MSNPFEFIRELREMNEAMVSRLDEIIKRLDLLIASEKQDLYGGRRVKRYEPCPKCGGPSLAEVVDLDDCTDGYEFCSRCLAKDALDQRAMES